MYVARFSESIQADIERGWSAWMNTYSPDLETVLTEYCSVDADSLVDGWERWQDEDHAPWHFRDHGDHQNFLEDYAESHNIKIAFDQHTQMWASVHHNGLACFRLQAETLDAAIAELREQFVDQLVGFARGDKTEGAVKVVHSECGWHILECDDVWVE